MAQSNPLGTIITWGAIGAGAYFIYEWLFATPAPAAAATPAPVATPTVPATTATAPALAACSMPPISLSQLQTMVQNAATAGMNGGDTAVTNVGGVLQATPDVFNYYLEQVQTAMPNCLPATYGWPPNASQVFPNQSQSAPISFTGYWAGLTAYLQGQGMSGIMRGLGMVVAAQKGAY